MTIITTKLNSIQREEYNLAFPEQQEYENWITSIENDYINECKYRAGVAFKVNRDNIVIINEELSPYSTVNS